MGERRGLNPRVVDSQSTALIHLATSAPTPAQGEAKAFHKWKLPGKASNKEVGLFIDLTSLYLRLKIRAGRAVIKALATCNCIRERHVTSKALRFASASSNNNVQEWKAEESKKVRSKGIASSEVSTIRALSANLATSGGGTDAEANMATKLERQGGYENEER
ncbi:hypothetical protein EJ110_NYTH36832 [Nymphaea thermarum]|nr:hypothetical protein EJ110_NYTH36832 [Nymphaea thermarum]